jgi:hypothetical protein
MYRTLKIPCARRFVEELTDVHYSRRYHNPKSELSWEVGIANKRHDPLYSDQEPEMDAHSERFLALRFSRPGEYPNVAITHVIVRLPQAQHVLVPAAIDAQRHHQHLLAEMNPVDQDRYQLKFI